MLIAVRNIKLTCEWHKAIKLNYKNTHTHVIVVLRLPSTLPQLTVAHSPRSMHYHVSCRAGSLDKYDITKGVQYVDTPEAQTFRWPLSPWPTLDIGVLGYIGIVWPKEHSPKVSHIPPVTPCISKNSPSFGFGWIWTWNVAILKLFLTIV